MDVVRLEANEGMSRLIKSGVMEKVHSSRETTDLRYINLYTVGLII